MYNSRLYPDIPPPAYPGAEPSAPDEAPPAYGWADYVTPGTAISIYVLL